MFETVNRDQTHAAKWERFRKQGLLPMWVADMDIAAPQAVTDALIERVQHPVYGYTHPWLSLNEAVVAWCQTQYQWEIEADWIVWMPGVVPSFNLAVDLFGQGGRVLVQTPNYPPMLSAAEKNGCTTVNIPVSWNGEQWAWDWAQLEREMEHADCHLFLLCNPMNPNGAVLVKQDLTKLAELCDKHDVFLCSDEIHCDLILDKVPHLPAGSIDGLPARSVTLMAASKTFNIAGLGCSFAIIPDANIRKRWQDRMNDRIPYPNFLGMVGAEAAFRHGHEWREGLLAALRENRAYLSDHLNRLDGMIYRPQPATFLAWVESDREDLYLDKHVIAAGIMPSEGKFFGSPRSIRLNFGTGLSTVKQGVQLLEDYWRQNTP